MTKKEAEQVLAILDEIAAEHRGGWTSRQRAEYDKAVRTLKRYGKG